MGYQADVKEIRHEKVAILSIGLMHVYELLDFTYLLLFVISIVLLDSVGIIFCISAYSLIRNI